MATMGTVAALFMLGSYLCCAHVQAGYWRDGEILFGHALQVTPSNSLAHRSLGDALLKKEKFDEALAQYNTFLRLTPSDAVIHNNVGLLLKRQGKMEEAIAHYQAALRIKPDAFLALNNLAWARATAAEARFRDGAEALKLARRADELTDHKDVEVLDTLAAAQAETGDFSAAARTAEQAAKLAEASNQKQMADQIRNRLKLYQAGRVFRE